VTRARALDAARILFVLLTVGFAWWGFRGRWGEIGAALADTSPPALVAAIGVTVLGLALTAVLWRRLLARCGSPLPERDASGIFLVGQLGKYIPGTVWTFAAQAQLARRSGVPARHSVAASGVFLLLHTATGAVLGAAAVAVGVLEADGPRWLWALGALGALAGLLPPVVSRIAAVVNGSAVPLALRDVGYAVLVMAGVWTAYGVGVLLLLLPGPAGPADLPAVVAAFALSHVAGVLLVVAPAGLGAREGVLIALLQPVAGLDAAIAVALLARVVHTTSDFALAGAAWGRVRDAVPA
jgi:glycosyltransferase 2 family protein